MSESISRERLEDAALVEVQGNAAATGQPTPDVVEGGLSPEQKAQLEGLEKTIATGLGGFVEVGKALKCIDDGKLYRTSAKLTFRDYCKAKWRMSSKHAYRLIKAAEFVGKLEQVGGADAIKVFPSNESQVRPLVDKLNVDQWVGTWQQVIDEVGDDVITAAVVAKVVQKQLRQPAEQVTGNHKTEAKQPPPNNGLQAIVDLVNDARNKTEGATIEFYKRTLDKILEELESQLKAV